jgi:hypothetical protein
MSKNAAMYQNPSAGRFDPRSAPSTPHESHARGSRRLAAMLVLALLAAQWLFPSPRGWASYLFAALAFAVMILEWVLLKNEADEKGPYTERITFLKARTGREEPVRSCEAS